MCVFTGSDSYPVRFQGLTNSSVSQDIIRRGRFFNEPDVKYNAFVTIEGNLEQMDLTRA